MDEYKVKLGVTINELTILSYSDKPDNEDKYKAYGGPWVRCQCSCGKEIVAPLYGIKRGFIKSCGHLKGRQGGEVLKEYHKTHDPANANYLTIDGETKNISEWSRITGIPRTTILYRLNKNVPLKNLFDKENDNDQTRVGNQPE
jgi:hypothetical protein